MDLPVNDAVDIAGSIDTVAPARNTRSAQRRRVASQAIAPAADLIVASATPGSIESLPVPEVLPEPFFNPATADLVDTIIEDDVMDSVNTPEPVAGTVNATTEQMVDRSQAAMAGMNGRAKDAMEKGSKMAEELGMFGKDTVEALVESSKIAAKGMEAIGQEAAEFTRRSFESATAAMKTLAATRSPTDFMKLQSDYARSMFDTLLAEASKSTEMMTKLASDVAQPISNRVAIAAEKMKITA